MGKMVASAKAVFLLLVVAVSAVEGWNSHELIPEKEDESCPNGEPIRCGRVIDKNGTVLRYERGNLTYGSSSIPSRDCPWKIRAPPGTGILLETTCYHHFHVRNLTEYAVCFSIKPDYDPFLYRTTSCSAGYPQRYSIPPNNIDLSVYYKNGQKYALGFTMLITFIGDPLPETTATSPPATEVAFDITTSGGTRAMTNFVLVIVAVLNAFHAL